ncbi:DUF1540 domain-containing protein [Metaclostridioides mangenotii]|uniref:DUF1540 domain-containing protein n=1 Tax=Metaclostridioides mangenotii TaxID=1540 RepID=UPI0026EACE7D|nr:DUF1540 domain-containing protein [Clostridioides mangenotii]
MSKINCNVTNCSYYDNNVCYAEKINISGKSAQKSESTNCSSFLEKEHYSRLTNNTNNGKTDLICNVSSCEHNGNGDVCNLQNIQVEPNTDKPVIYSETYCGSFESRM